MKKLAMALVLGSSLSAFAQGSISTSQEKIAPSESQNGMYVGADYMNITDVHMKFTARSQGQTFSSSSVGGVSLGMAGVTLGYNKTPEIGLGFRGGAQLLQSINKSESGDTTFQILIPEFNGTLAIHQKAVLFAGVNTSVWGGSEGFRKYKSGLGLQAGITGRINRNLALNAGYTMMTQTLSDNSFGSSVEMEVQASGFNSNVTYTF